MRAAGRLLGMAAVAALAACAPRPAPAPPAVPAPQPPAPPPPPPLEETAAHDWRDLPLTAGDWHYRSADNGSEASFGGAEPSLVLRCDTQRRQIALSRTGAAAGQAVTVRTSHGSRGLGAGTPLPGADPFLDAIVFSRGRFTVEAEGLPALIVPAWPEPGRVVEDCRN